MVREVISVPKTRQIPNAPAHFYGLMDLRGEIISIIDLRKKLKTPEAESKEEAVIIVDLGDVSVGVVVDFIKNVLAFRKCDMSEMPSLEYETNNKFILGVFKKEHSLTVLLDMVNILDQKDRAIIHSQSESVDVAKAA